MKPDLPFAAVLCAIPVFIWFYLLFARGWFWQVKRHLPPTASLQSIPSRKVAVVIPARNEADVVAQTVSSLLAQDFNGVLRIFLVDDSSTDGTADAAAAAAIGAGRSDQLTIVYSALREGWTGKMSAVAQGVEQALSMNPDYLLLTDADIYHDPRNVSQLIAIADEGGYDLVSLMVKLEARSLAERALIPAFVFFFLLLYPPAWTGNSRRKTAGAAGGCILVRPERLRIAGGIAAIRSEIIDDCALARIVKRSGGKLWLGLAEHTRSTRSYGSFKEIERMISRTAFNQLNHSVALLAGTLLGLAITYVLPVVCILPGRLDCAALGAVAWLLMALSYVPMVRFYRLNPLWALSLPAVAMFYGAATAHSAIKFWRGRGGEWKGRVQDGAANS
ncbi:MAG TPA: glycosyltransferase [Bryobacteraceae bacterium]|nr:glycosyltransferase [Bryobacteraceae bacterium]